MNRELFKTKLNDLCNHPDKILSEKEQKELITKGINHMDTMPLTTYSGSHNVLIAIEELSEITQELILHMINLSLPKQVGWGLREELADCEISLEFCIQIFDLDESKIYHPPMTGIAYKENDICSITRAAVFHFATLSQQLTKTLRGKQDEYVITKQIAYCIQDIQLIKKYYAISETEHQAARSIKMIRCSDEIDKNPKSYQ